LENLEIGNSKAYVDSFKIQSHRRFNDRRTEQNYLFKMKS